MLLTAILIFIPTITLIYITLIGYNYSKEYKNTLIYGTPLITLIKLATLCSLFTSLAYQAMLWKTYPIYDFESKLMIYPGSRWLEFHNNLNLPFLILSTFILILIVLNAWYTEVDTVLYCCLVLLTEICLVGAFGTNSIFLFLLFFELSAIPIFILIAYSGSPRRERIKAAYYFIFFTLYGSISLLLLILNTYSFTNIDFALENDYMNLTGWLLLFIGFGVKIPLFPFHIWLPYAHVEASTPASIVLAALMLKLGGFGVIKYIFPLFNIETHLFFRAFAIIICIIGVLYGGLVAIRQLDLKRQIAFSSISHMSFATLGMFTFTEVGIKGAMYLMLSHGLTSSALFYLIGVLSERHHTRSILAFGGLLGVMPVFSFFLLVASLANVGFPGTSGFIPEFLILIAVISTLPSILPGVLLGMLATTAATLIALLRLMFGHPKNTYSKSSWADLVRIEFLILFVLSFWMVFVGLYDILSSSIPLIA